ncbi:MAG TPA: glycosyltransferase [Micropepsaceae bacterium]|jgi:glycosyltransferase involved in cell wall biosynthesis|nr:glycosyltransferase [Micropepsaceae bacterium]
MLHDLRGGGAERVNLRLIEGMLASGRNVDLVLVRGSGEFLSDIPAGARVFDLKKKRVIQAIFALARYLRRERPTAVLSSLSHVNLAAIIAVWLSRLKVNLIVCEHNQISQKVRIARGFVSRMTYRAVSFLYPRASAIVAVSKGVADDLIAFAGLESNNVHVIYNPVYEESMRESAAADPAHPWFQSPAVPVILAIGRLNEQKGFDILLHAFQRVRSSLECRLVILGEGTERAALEKLCQTLGLTDDVALPGFVANPFALMARSDLFVLSSRWEGLPTVLIEALACGAPVVSTDCPSGPREILDDGRFGTLVPTNDPEALAAAILKSLNGPRQSHVERGRCFSTPASVFRYLELLES